MSSFVPSEPGRTRISWAWVNVGMAALAMVGTLPGRTQGLGLVTEALLADLRLNRVDFASINLWATLIGAAFCLPCGRLVDRFGSRAVLTVVLAALGGSVLAMSHASGMMALAFWITLTRGFGQSALSVVSLALVGKWFGRNLNMAMGVYSVLVGVGFIAAFPSVGAAVLRYGWRATWGGVGWALLLALTPLAFALVRNGPEDQGLRYEEARGLTRDLTFGEALRSQAFWAFALASAIFGLVYSGIALFNESILAQRGFDPTVYHQVLVVSTMLGLAANFGGGWLATRWPLQRLMGAGMAVLALALLLLPLVTAYSHVMAYAAAMGIAGGVVTVVFFTAWGQVFGRGSLGRIQGAAQMLTVLASAVGPLLLARTLESTGSYDGIFYGLAVVVAMLGVWAWIAPLPRRSN